MIKKDLTYYKKYFYFMTEVVLLILLMGFYNDHTTLLPHSCKFYSSSIAYRLQTNAFLEGQLSLSQHPFGLPYDFDYSEFGMQQNWGLGVPLLRLPFEWIAKIAGFDYFPDRLILLFYLVLVIVLMNFGLGSAFSSAGLMVGPMIGFIIRWGLIAWFLFDPSMSGLIQDRFNVYEEAVFYGCMYSAILLVIFWTYLQRPNKRTFIMLCLLSGLAWIIRPTLVFYGLVTVGLAMVYTYQSIKNIQLIMIGSICFLSGVVINLVLNYLRFGSMLEFGYSLNLNHSTGGYIQKFGAPYDYVSFINAAKELLYALFFRHRYEASQYYRLRHFYFHAFNASHLLILMAGVGLFILLTVNRSSMRIISFSLAWGILSFTSLFLFYAHALSITSRYLSEFSVAYFAVLAVLVLSILLSVSSCHDPIKKRLFLSFFLLGFLILFYLNNRVFFKERPRNPYVTSKENIKKMVDSFDHQILANPSLPGTFYCGRSYGPINSNFQFSGWDISKNCLVSYSTSIFLPTKRCLTINYSILGDGDLMDVRVRRGFIFLKPEALQIAEDSHGVFPGHTITQRFCSERFLPKTIALYSIGWIKTHQIKSVDDTLPIRLNWASIEK